MEKQIYNIISALSLHARLLLLLGVALVVRVVVPPELAAQIPVGGHLLQHVLVGHAAQVLGPSVGVLGVEALPRHVGGPGPADPAAAGAALHGVAKEVHGVGDDAPPPPGGAQGVRHIVLPRAHVHVVHRAVDHHLARGLVPRAELHGGAAALQHLVHALRHVVRHPHVALVHLDEDGERGRAHALHDALLAPARARLIVPQRHRGDAAHQVRQRGVLDEVLQQLPVRGAHQLHPALGDGAARQRLLHGADLVHDDHLRHVILHRLDHHAVLLARVRHLHAARAADGGVRDVAVAADLVGRVDDHHALAQLVRQHPGHLADHRGLAHARPAQEQDGLRGPQQVRHHVDVARHGAPHAARQPHDLAPAVADARDAVQRALDAGAVVAAELAHGGLRGVQVVLVDGRRAQALVAQLAREARLGAPAEVQDHLQERVAVLVGHQDVAHVSREHIDDHVEVVHLLLVVVGGVGSARRVDVAAVNTRADVPGRGRGGGGGGNRAW
mmetsp:Transcript_2519/g.5651  ORF Transcript_2519/g.5651 Transcript_2519/m.5651 type:complete len:500 (+) Transcript_2519:372-1871(+)